MVEKLPLLPEYVQARIANSKRYYAEIVAKNISCPEPVWGYWRLTIVLAKINRDKIVKTAAMNDLIITTHYRSLSGLATFSNSPIADEIDKQIMNLFVRAETSSNEIERTITFLNEHADDK